MLALVLVALARILNRPWSIALRGADMPALTTRVNLATGTLSVLLMLLLVPREIPQLGLDDLPGMGGEGAALALLGPELLAGVWLRWYCYRELALPPSRQVLRQLAAALLVADKVADLREGAAMAARSIDSGAARAKLKQLAAVTGPPPET